MQNMIRRFLLAVSFLTILPFNFFSFGIKDKEQINQDLSKASIYFPLIGLLIGTILVVLYDLLQLIPFHPALINGIILMVWITLSGGLHLEGFADMVDGFSGGRSKEDIIRIMKEGSVGAKGAIALTMLILFKFLLIHTIDDAVKLEAFLLAPVAGRWSMVLAGYWGQPASSNNTLTRMFTLYLGKKELFIATLFTIGFGFYRLSYQFVFFLILSGIITRCMVRYSNTKIQGICGDVIGAINEVNEVCFLFVFILYEAIVLGSGLAI